MTEASDALGLGVWSHRGGPTLDKAVYLGTLMDGSKLALETTPWTGHAWCSNREGASEASDALGLGVWRCRHMEPQAPRSGAWGGSTSEKKFIRVPPLKIKLI